MREDLKKIIFVEDISKKRKKRMQIGENVFKSYALQQDIGQKILDGLFSKTVVVEESDGTPVRHFILDGVEKRTGFLSDVYGCTGVFSLINRFDVSLSDEQKADLSRTVEWVLSFIKRHGFTLNPYIKTSEAVFSKDDPFYGAMTWCLSLLANLCRAWRNNYFEVNETAQKLAYNLMADIIQAFNDGAKLDANGNCIGWGFTPLGKQPSLFYTYSVLEAYSDFEDSVLGGEDVDAEDLATEEEEENLGAAIASRDKKLVAYLKGRINSRSFEDGREINGLKFWRECCLSAAKHVWGKAEGIIKKGFIGDNFFTEDGVVPAISEAEIMKSSTSNALFNTLFVVFTGIYGYVNKVDQDGAKDDKEDVIETMKEALQNVQKTYEKLAQKGLEYVVDSYSFLFQSGVGKNSTDFERMCSAKLNPENIFDSSLLPLLVKSNSILALYIQKFPQKEMDQHFENLFGKISVADWEDKSVFVWDVNKYNVKNTERYLEAVADFYEYYETYEKGYVNVKEHRDEIIAREVEAGEVKWRQENDQKFKEKYEKKLEDWKKEESQKHQFEQLFAAEMKRLATEAFEDKILTSIDNIVSAREHNDLASLSEFEKAFAQRFSGLLMSLLDKYLIEVSLHTDVKGLHDVVAKDLDVFMASYAERIAKAAKDEKPVLNEVIFKSKTKEEEQN